MAYEIGDNFSRSSSFDSKSVTIGLSRFVELGYLSTNSRKSGVFSMISTRLSTGLSPNPATTKPQYKIDINFAVYPRGPSPPVKPKLLSLVDTKEVMRGPEEQPGYWVVTGAKLCVEAGKISIKAKYSLPTVISEDSLV